ncbi:MAG: hypothetical protein CM1200mP28_13250 [Deltaproteobacteria bacterium]|nr:MAG: hypothetical protein CM1200mP28_13250 [Deltaproteobacteria bacterium]
MNLRNLERCFPATISLSRRLQNPGVDAVISGKIWLEIERTDGVDLRKKVWSISGRLIQDEVSD